MARSVGIIWLAQSHKKSAHAGERFQFALRFLDAEYPDRLAALRRDSRQRGQRARRSLMAVDQGAKRLRPDALAADEAQPVESLGVCQAHAGEGFWPRVGHDVWPMRLSVPAISREIFSRCLTISARPRTMKRPASGARSMASKNTGAAAVAASAAAEE